MRPTAQAPRRKRVKGQWMRLRDPDLLARYMENADFNQARLARYAECSRQFISLLLKGERRTCTEKIADRIEEALRVLPNTLFVDEKSPGIATSVGRKGTAA
jgi:transcriptional regulator with XRE-family HTH domain